MLEVNEKSEEIRTICRLHGCPTGRWEDLADLPLRLSQDAGLRSYFVEIIRSLQSSGVFLPDALDVVVLAVGGPSAPKHTRQLTEQLNLLGGFLASVGRWPGDDARPILAPGEVPENIHQFIRPQPRTAPPAAPATPAPQPRREQLQAEYPQAEYPREYPQAEYRQSEYPQAAPAPPASRYPNPGTSTATYSEPQASGTGQVDIPAQSAPNQRPRIYSDAPANLQPTPEPRVPFSSPANFQLTPEPRVPFSSPANRQPNPAPQQSPTSDPTPSPASDIARALARLERGNLELRAHLDSIDQRISRMEPLLESTAPPEPTSPATPPEPPTPLLIHRQPPSSKNFRLVPEAAPRPTPDAASAIPSPTAIPSPSPVVPSPASVIPSPASVSPSEVEEPPFRPATRSGPSPASVIPSEVEEPALRPATAPVIPRNGSAHPASFHTRAPEAARRSAPAATSVVASPASVSPSPTSVIPSEAEEPAFRPAPTPISRPKSIPFAPRFSRFSDESGQLPPDPLPAPSRPSSSRNLGPVALPQGFFGTAPTSPDSSEADTETELPDPPRRNRGRHFALVATLLILLGLIGAAFLLYTRTAAAPDDAGISPTAAPQPASGPLTATPTNPSPTPDTGAAKARVLGARSSFQPRQTSEIPADAGGFRPAGTFVPSSVMDGHLISAPLPDQSRIPASSREKGIVVMEANISSAGQVEDVHILGGNGSLRTAAIDAVRNWQYKPYLLNGSPVEVRTIIRIDFAQRRAEPAAR